MINEGQPAGRFPESAATGLSIDLFGHQPKEEEQDRGQIYLVDPEAIIAGYSLKD